MNSLLLLYVILISCYCINEIFVTTILYTDYQDRILLVYYLYYIIKIQYFSSSNLNISSVLMNKNLLIMFMCHCYNYKNYY